MQSALMCTANHLDTLNLLNITMECFRCDMCSLFAALMMCPLLECGFSLLLYLYTLSVPILGNWSRYSWNGKMAVWYYQLGFLCWNGVAHPFFAVQLYLDVLRLRQFNRLEITSAEGYALCLFLSVIFFFSHSKWSNNILCFIWTVPKSLPNH